MRSEDATKIINLYIATINSYTYSTYYTGFFLDRLQFFYDINGTYSKNQHKNCNYAVHALL